MGGPAGSDFVVTVGRLLRRPGERKEIDVAGPLAGLRVTDTWVPEDQDVEVRGTLESVPQALVAHLWVTAPWEADCRRCLRTVSGTVSSEVRELFESSATSDDAYPLSGDQVDLEPLARDAVLLELPLAPLCTEECAGLCPVCGANRNEVDCECEPDTRDPRWAALDALREPED